MRLATAIVLALALSACDGAIEADPDADLAGPVDAAAEPDAMRPPAGPPLGDFELTYYWVASEDDHPGVADTILPDDTCAELALVSADFADAIRLEGTGRLYDGRLLNVDGPCQCGGGVCYMEAEADHPWGYGVQNRALVPFRSVAVDRDVIAYGTGLYLAELDGVLLPGETPWGEFVHDGCVVAADTGGGIVDLHVDFFVGLREAYRALDTALALDTIAVDDGGDRCADQAP